MKKQKPLKHFITYRASEKYLYDFVEKKRCKSSWLKDMFVKLAKIPLIKFIIIRAGLLGGSYQITATYKVGKQKKGAGIILPPYILAFIRSMFGTIIIQSRQSVTNHCAIR